MQEENKLQQYRIDWWKIIGLGLLVVGATLFVETRLHTGWIYYLPIIVLSAIALWTGLHHQSRRMMLFGLSLLSACLILFEILVISLFTVAQKLGIAFLIVGLCWIVYLLFEYKKRNTIAYWVTLVAGGFLGTGMAFLWRQGQFIDFVLWIGIGLSVPMLLWGYAKQYYGLLIAGCIVLSGGVGVYIAWGSPDETINSLARTGVMLITFALGWGGISVLSRRCFEKMAWWPLIPAGVLLMSGGGLFIGGSPGSSKEYVGNTLSLALIILGVYVLLLRSGFSKKS